MALTGIFNSSDREIVLTPFQAQIFNQTIQYFKTTGVGGDNVFEDTYVLQKRVAEYIKENVTTSGGSASSFVNQIYNGVLGIAPPPPPPPRDSYTPDNRDSYTPDNDVFTRDNSDDVTSSDVVFDFETSSDVVFDIDAGSSAGESNNTSTTRG